MVTRPTLTLYNAVRIIRSKTFTFFIGPERKSYTLHSKLIAHHSISLGVLIDGPMSEAKQGSAVLEDVDEDTFARFCQFLYTGYYSAAADHSVTKVLMNTEAVGTEEVD